MIRIMGAGIKKDLDLTQEDRQVVILALYGAIEKADEYTDIYPEGTHRSNTVMDVLKLGDKSRLLIDKLREFDGK